MSQSGTEFHSKSNSGNKNPWSMFGRVGFFWVSGSRQWQSHQSILPRVPFDTKPVCKNFTRSLLCPPSVLFLNCNKIFCFMMYTIQTDLKLTWFECFQKILKFLWLVESQTIKDVLTFALQKCISIINLEWIFPTRKMANILCIWRMGNMDR